MLFKTGESVIASHRLVGPFYGISIFVGYLMPNYVYTYIKPNILK